MRGLVLTRRLTPRLMVLLGCLLLVLVLVLGEALWIAFSGTRVPRPTISREAQTIGNGPPLTFAVLGDSTAVSQGGAYTEGYAVAVAKHLAAHHQVTWSNVAVPGARAHDVATEQLGQVAPYRPDVVVMAVGANDVTHLTKLATARTALQQTIAGLRRANPEVKIILTGSPDMGSVPRFPQPVRWLAGKRTEQFNRMVIRLAQDEHVTFAPIAARTGPAFRHNPRLFAVDKFHPNTAGYQLWAPVIIEAIDTAQSSR